MSDPPGRTAPPADDPGLVSVVIPVRNNADTLVELLARTTAALDGAGRPFEVLVADDGSTDGGWAIVVDAARGDDRVAGLRIAPGRGQSSAVSTAMHLVRGHLVAYIDADLEYAPEDLVRIFQALDDGADVVLGHRDDDRPRAWTRRLLSELVRRAGPPELAGRVVDPGCGIKGWRLDAYRRALPTDHLVGGVLQVIPLALASGRVANLPVATMRSGSRSQYRAVPLILSGLEYQLLGRPRALRTLVLGGLAATATSAAVLATSTQRRGPHHPSLVPGIALGLAGAGLTLNAATASLLTTALRSTIPPRVVETVGVVPAP